MELWTKKKTIMICEFNVIKICKGKHNTCNVITYIIISMHSGEYIKILIIYD